jgi:anti-repressor protein
MNELITFKDGVAVVDTVTIADGVGYPHKNVIALCRKHLDDLKDFGRVEFIIQPFQTKGGPQSREVAILTEDQAILLMAFMQNNEIVRKFKVSLVKAFRSVRDALAKAQNRAFAQLPDFTNPAIAARAWADEVEKNQKLIEQAKADAPKVEFSEAVVASDAEMTITATAKVLGIGPRKFFDWLRLNGFLYKQANQATQDAINRGYMVVRFHSIQHDDGVEQKAYPHVTGAGLFYFYGRLRKENLIQRNEKLELAA